MLEFFVIPVILIALLIYILQLALRATEERKRLKTYILNSYPNFEWAALSNLYWYKVIDLLEGFNRTEVAIFLIQKAKTLPEWDKTLSTIRNTDSICFSITDFRKVLRKKFAEAMENRVFKACTFREALELVTLVDKHSRDLMGGWPGVMATFIRENPAEFLNCMVGRDLTDFATQAEKLPHSLMEVRLAIIDLILDAGEEAGSEALFVVKRMLTNLDGHELFKHSERLQKLCEIDSKYLSQLGAP